MLPPNDVLSSNGAFITKSFIKTKSDCNFRLFARTRIFSKHQTAGLTNPELDFNEREGSGCTRDLLWGEEVNCTQLSQPVLREEDVLNRLSQEWAWFQKTARHFMDRVGNNKLQASTYQDKLLSKQEWHCPERQKLLCPARSCHGKRLEWKPR